MQINNIKNKLYYLLSLLHRYKYKCNINTLVMLYFSFFHSNIKDRPKDTLYTIVSLVILIIVLLYGEVLTIAI